jgi:hypothetical protein
MNLLRDLLGKELFFVIIEIKEVKISIESMRSDNYAEIHDTVFLEKDPHNMLSPTTILKTTLLDLSLTVIYF